MVDLSLHFFFLPAYAYFRLNLNKALLKASEV